MSETSKINLQIVVIFLSFILKCLYFTTIFQHKFLDFSFVKNLKIAKTSKNTFFPNIFINGLFGLTLDKFCPNVLKVTEHSYTFYAMRKKTKRANAQARHSLRKHISRNLKVSKYQKSRKKTQQNNFLLKKH